MLLMAKINPSWTNYFREQENPFHGWVTSLAEANALIGEYEVVMQSHYVVVRETKQFGSFDLSCSHKVKHVDDGKIKKGSRINNHGIPFMITGQKLLECHQGSTHRHPKLIKENNVDQKNKQRKVTGTKKLGCESCIVLREVVFFPDFKPVSPTEHHQKQKSKQLRAALQSSSAENVQCEKRIFIDLPEKESHSHQLTGDATDIKVPVKRHSDKNVKLSAGLRKKGPGVPDITAHKPLHQLQQLRDIDIAASPIDKADLQQDGERQFLFPSSPLSDTVYEFDLTSQNTVQNWPEEVPHAKPVINEKGKNLKTIQEDFRQKLTVLMQLSYMCNDPETLERSTTTINDITSTMQSKCNKQVLDLQDMGNGSSKQSDSLPKRKKLKKCHSNKVPYV